MLCSLLPRMSAGSQFNDGDFTTYIWTAVKTRDTTASQAAGQTAGFDVGEALTGGIIDVDESSRNRPNNG